MCHNFCLIKKKSHRNQIFKNQNAANSYLVVRASGTITDKKRRAHLPLEKATTKTNLMVPLTPKLKVQNFSTLVAF